MIKIIRGIIVLMGIMLIFLLLTACSTDGVFTKKSKLSQKTDDYNTASEKEEYSYDEEVDNGKNSNYYTKDIQSEQGTYYQKGYASWYGREFHGRITASGERFDMNKLTAAHKKLPFGTRILVKNLENDKSVSVTINDRGPYQDGRILDLSYAAAKKLGIIESGEAKVGITVLKKGNEERNNIIETNDIEPVVGKNSSYGEDINAGEYDKNDSLEDSHYNGNYYSIQAGAFYSHRNAEKLQRRLERLVDNPVVVINDNDMYKVRIDKFKTRTDVSRVRNILESEDISSYIIDNQK